MKLDDKPKFTPGPWHVVLAADHNERIAIAAKGAEKYSSRGLVALVGKRHKASVANANLIAAAPDMYEALEIVLEENSMTTHAADMIEKALSKARGESEVSE